MKRYLCLPRARLERAPYAIESVQPEHIQTIRQWRNAQISILRQRAPLSAEQQTRYYATHIWPSMNEARPGNVLLGYFLGGQLIGYGGLVHIAWEHRRAEVSFLLDPARNDNGAGYSLAFLSYLALIQELAFVDLGFHRLFTETYAIREQQISLLGESGFRLEGVMREHVFIDGQPVDSILQGCLSTIRVANPSV